LEEIITLKISWMWAVVRPNQWMMVPGSDIQDTLLTAQNISSARLPTEGMAYPGSWTGPGIYTHARVYHVYCYVEQLLSYCQWVLTIFMLVLSYILLHTYIAFPVSKLVRMTVGCGIYHKNTKKYVQFTWSFHRRKQRLHIRLFKNTSTYIHQYCQTL
jgi:hypothetical protein